MIKALRTAFVCSIIACSLISCSKSAKTCVGCGQTCDTESVEFPVDLTEEKLSEIFTNFEKTALAYDSKTKKLCKEQNLCVKCSNCNCSKEFENSVANCFRCEKLIFKSSDKTVQVCDECTAYLKKYMDDLMVKIPAAAETNGSISDFYVSKYETTQELFKMIMGYNHSYRSGSSRPVECIHDDEIKEFCSRLSSITGQNYRLLNNLEFDFITKDISYASIQHLNNISWNVKNSGESTHDVGTTKNSTKYGLYDLIGNVWEVVEYYDGTAENPVPELRRRCGAYNNDIYKSNPNYEAFGSDINLADQGFRVARDAD